MTSKPALNVLTRLPAQVHIRAHPPPKNLAESKQIFAALQRYGEIISFRNLKYDIFNDTERERPLLAIFDSNEAAERAIAASPLTVDLPPRTSPTFPRNPYATIPGSPRSKESSKASSSPPSPSISTSPPTPTSTQPAPSITCTIETSRHNYERATRRNPFYSMFTIDKSSPIYKDMRSEETATPLPELADVLQRTKKPTFATQRYGTRVHAQRLGADSLMKLWKKGVAERQGKGKAERSAGVAQSETIGDGDGDGGRMTEPGEPGAQLDGFVTNKFDTHERS
ncbi:Uncharacterized protein PECH_002745 [Penicillium ucsense]|uniref:Uncharacterized protein n=1 Tax=Penicillium ucsense TaxID=2839758 RepID=A0A8J8WG12_9EURO|nr:Uncharacterized protein PECM_000537 [Penicillium ucsense]KAF7730515.1 Uncharacterized protein PECH_002745 [Penicillium ucsense]